MRKLDARVLVVWCLAWPCAAVADVVLIGKASIAGDARDMSGLGETVCGGVPGDRLGSFGSGIDFTGKDDLYIAVDDRGPGDGECKWRNRFQTFRIKIDPAADVPVRVELVATTLLSDERGGALDGQSAGIDFKDQGKGVRFDPEGVRVSDRGTIFISDEYGPWIDEFSREGKRLRRWSPPGKFMIERPDADAAKELAQGKGRQANRGFEGLAILPDGRTLLAILQSPLLQDHGLERGAETEGKKKGEKAGSFKRNGVNNRILELDTATGKTREFVYRMENAKHGVNEILAIHAAPRRALVLERDNKQGSEAGRKALYLIDLSGATDVSGVESLPAGELPAGVKPVSKRMFLDFMDPKFGLVGATMPEKIEGVCFGPRLADGRWTLVVTNDNDLKEEVPNWFWVFAVDPAELMAGAAPKAAAEGGRNP